MSGEPRKVISQFIPPPIDGLNLISAPADFKVTEARDLNNYYVYDWGIRQRGSCDLIIDGTVGDIRQIIPLQGEMLLCTSSGLKKMGSPTDSAPANIAGAPSYAAQTVSWCHFDDYIFLARGSTHHRYQISAATLTASPFTGPTALSHVWAYKGHIYGVDSGTQTIWDGGLLNVAGAMTSYAFSQFIDSTAPILFGASFTVNQGTANDELWMICTTDGEILIYAGDGPGEANWQFIGRTFIPAPASRIATRKLGGDLLISTVRGVVSMRQVFASINAADAAYYAVSRKLGQYSLGENNDNLTLNPNAPFLYMPVSDGMFVLNYERGAWSKFTPTESEGGAFQVGAYGFDAYFYYTNGSQLWRLNDSNGVSTTASYSWKTSFFDFGRHQQKHSKFIRALVRQSTEGGNTSGSLTVRCAITANYIDSNIGAYGEREQDGTLSDYSVAVQQLEPPGSGRTISYNFLEVPSAAHIPNELLGFESVYELGGLTGV